MFFWAPLMKWCLVAAGLKDLSRPAEKLSVSQNLGAYPMYLFLASSEVSDQEIWSSPIKCPNRAIRPDACPTALAATGFIWVRYSLVITPINYSLAAVRPLSTCLSEANTRSTFVFQVNFFVGSTGLGQLGRIW